MKPIHCLVAFTFVAVGCSSDTNVDSGDATPDASSVSTETVPSTDQPSASCPSPSGEADPMRQRLFADVDGDGSSEVVLLDRSTSTTTLTICDSATINVAPWDLGDGNKPASVQIIDVENDDRDELLIGGPTGAGPFAGSVFSFTPSGFAPSDMAVAVRLPSEDTAGESFTCVDGELQSISYTYEGGTVLANSTSMRWNSSLGSSGEMALPAETLDAWLLTRGTCGAVVTQPFGPDPVTDLLRSVFDPSALGRFVASDQVVALGLGNELITERTGTELATPAGWLIDRDDYTGFAGPFSAVETLANAGEFGRTVQVGVGTHDHCAGPPLATPEALTDLTEVHLQPLNIDSCLQWFAINVFVAADFTVEAVTLELFGP